MLKKTTPLTTGYKILAIAGNWLQGKNGPFGKLGPILGLSSRLGFGNYPVNLEKDQALQPTVSKANTRRTKCKTALCFAFCPRGQR
jgi:hypothetical protein